MLISYRKAAEVAATITGKAVHAPQLQRAIKAEALEFHKIGEESGFDQNEVMIWAYKRKTPDAVAEAMDELHKVWSEVAPWMMGELQRLTKAGDYSHKELNKRGAFYFTHACNRVRDDTRYTYSEGLFFQRKENEDSYKKQTSGMHDFAYDLDSRFLFSIYHLALNMMDATADQMAKLDWLTEKFGDPKDPANFEDIVPFIKFWSAVTLGKDIGESV